MSGVLFIYYFQGGVISVYGQLCFVAVQVTSPFVQAVEASVPFVVATECSAPFVQAVQAGCGS